MARKPMVTRTIQTTYASIMVVNTTVGEVRNVEVTLPRTYKDEDAILKAAKPVVESDPTIKAVCVAHHEVREALYGMTEAEFIVHAKVLPPRTPGSGDNTDTEDGAYVDTDSVNTDATVEE